MIILDLEMHTKHLRKKRKMFPDPHKTSSMHPEEKTFHQLQSQLDYSHFNQSKMCFGQTKENKINMEKL